MVGVAAAAQVDRPLAELRAGRRALLVGAATARPPALASPRQSCRMRVRAAAGAGVDRGAPPSRLRLWTMGGFVIEVEGRRLEPADFERQKARTLLAALLCAGQAVHREQLLEWFWPQASPECGLRCLYTTLYALRQTLEPTRVRGCESAFVACEGESYRLCLDECGRWDAADILRAGSPRPQQDAVSLVALERAEAACAGSFLPEWPYAAWAQARRAQIEEAERTLLERLAEAQIAAGRPHAAIGRFLRLVDREPECERFHRGLIRAYAEAGELGLALRQYSACRALLRERQGTDPSPETRSLYERLLHWDGGASVGRGPSGAFARTTALPFGAAA